MRACGGDAGRGSGSGSGAGSASPVGTGVSFPHASHRLDTVALDRAYAVAARQVEDGVVPFVILGVANAAGSIRLEAIPPKDGRAGRAAPSACWHRSPSRSSRPPSCGSSQDGPILADGAAVHLAAGARRCPAGPRSPRGTC